MQKLFHVRRLWNQKWQIKYPGYKSRRFGTFKALGPYSVFLLFVSIAKDLFQLKANMTPKTHLNCPRGHLAGKKQEGRSPPAFRLPPCKNVSHGTILRTTLLLACMPEWSFSEDLSCTLKQERVRDRTEWISSQTWNIQFTCIVQLFSHYYLQPCEGFQEIW